MRNDFSEYIIFSDESGDNGLHSINQENPIFVLVFCMFRKSDYISIVNQAVSKFKMDFWGHDLVIFHNREIRKSAGDFSFLFDEEKRRVFLHAINEMIKSLPFSVVAAAIDKRHLKDRSLKDNPYFLALRSCLQQTIAFLTAEQQIGKQTHIVFESRGKTEDRELGMAFQQLIGEMLPEQCPLKFRFASKQTNSSGLQIADLMAHPIARYVLNKAQPNKAFEIVQEKLLGYSEYGEVGLKAYPLESEKNSRPLYKPNFSLMIDKKARGAVMLSASWIDLGVIFWTHERGREERL